MPIAAPGCSSPSSGVLTAECGRHAQESEQGTQIRATSLHDHHHAVRLVTMMRRALHLRRQACPGPLMACSPTHCSRAEHHALPAPQSAPFLRVPARPRPRLHWQPCGSGVPLLCNTSTHDGLDDDGS